jgi:ABC-2 type transport system permease protein
MPSGLQQFAEQQPVTAAVDAVRALVLGGSWGGKALETLAWSAAIAIVFGYLTVRRYRRAV